MALRSHRVSGAPRRATIGAWSDSEAHGWWRPTPQLATARSDETKTWSMWKDRLGATTAVVASRSARVVIGWSAEDLTGTEKPGLASGCAEPSTQLALGQPSIHTGSGEIRSDGVGPGSSMLLEDAVMSGVTVISPAQEIWHERRA